MANTTVIGDGGSEFVGDGGSSCIEGWGGNGCSEALADYNA
jgi:hypothetical protein